MTPSAITRIGKYEVVDVIGRGGMGLVYRAYDRQLNRHVAIKTITEGLTGDREMLARFYREAAKTAALQHPNIVIVYDLGEYEGFPFIVMQYLSGEPLDRLIKSQRPVPMGFTVKVIEQVCSALGYAHRNDVIHRDVKPGNVIVDQEGLAKLLDFGIATQRTLEGTYTRTGHVLGTLPYMAPERLQNRHFDGRSDIFSTGILLFQLLTGQLPFSGEDYGVVSKLINDQHPALSNYLHEYPSGLDPILDRALAKDPDDRYATAEEMADELRVIGEQLKQEEVSELLRRGQELASEDQFTAARDTLLQLLKLDSQNIEARRLLVRVQNSLASQQRVAKLRQLKLQATELFGQSQYDEAISCLQQALKLEYSTEVVEMLASAQQKKRSREQAEARLRQAESALEKGDLPSAQAILAQAVDVDKEDTRIRVAYSALRRRVEEKERQTKLKSLLDAARGELESSHFTAALHLLREAEQVDDSNAAVISLISSARAGHEQQQRRRLIEKLQNEMEMASTLEQLTNAARGVDEALGHMPDQPELKKFKIELAEKIREAEARRRVTQRKQELLRQAQNLISRADYGAVLELLSKVRPEEEDPAFRALRENASSLQHAQNAQLQSVLDQLKQLIENNQYEEAFAFGEGLPSPMMQNPDVQNKLNELREASRRDDRVVQSISRAYWALKCSDLSGALAEMHSTLGISRSVFVDSMVRMFEERCKAAADKKITEAIQGWRSAVRGNPRRAANILNAVGSMLPYASNHGKLTWRSAQRQAKLASALGRLGIPSKLWFGS